MRRATLSALMLVLAVGLAACSDQPDKPRRQQTLKLLPDTPPPPPPPPKPEDKPPPRPEDKPQPQAAPKPVEAPPEPQQLKSDEAAGSGPGNGLAAGSVTQDYQGGPTGSGTTVGGGTATDGLATRLAANAFGSAATRALNDFLTRDREVKQHDYRVRIAVWFTPAGGVQRTELVDSTGNTTTDAALRAALQRFSGTGTPPPANLPQPLRVMVSNRLLG